MAKTKVMLIYGGQSTEHDISRRSAKLVLQSLLAEDFEVIPVAITKQGQWLTQNLQSLEACTDDSLPIGEPAEKTGLFDLEMLQNLPAAEEPLVAFPVLHGRNGEDGVCQGFFQLKNWAFVGADTLGSAVSMDKVVAKTLVHAAGIPIAPFLAIHASDWQDAANQDEFVVSVQAKLKLPYFVKPANLGSSVGITKVETASELRPAIASALKYDNKILVESMMRGREIEFAILGGREIAVTGPGEVASGAGFYTFDEKYSAKSVAKVIIPAPMSLQEKEDGQDLACKAFKALNLWGMARIDFFLDQTGRYVFNEANTLPGFTSISQYPLLWREEGLDSGALVQRLVATALERWHLQQSIQLNF